MKRKLFLLITTTLFVTLSYGQDTTPGTPVKLTLEDCLYYAMSDNYARQSILLNEDKIQSSLSQSKQERLPSLSANLSESVSNTNAGGTSWGGNYDLSASLTVFQGGKISNEIKQNELQYEQTRLQTQQQDNELTIKILQAFLSAIANEELLKYQESIVQTSARQMQDGKAQFTAGQILESDYLLLEAQYATDENNINSTRISLYNSLVALKNLMSMELSQAIELIYPDDSALEIMLNLPSQEVAVARGMETMPDILISEYNVKIAETSLKISKASYYPTISLNAGIGTGHAQNFENYGRQLSDRFGPQGGISISIPIFDKGRTRNNVRQSEIALKQAELDRKNSLMNIEQTLINEYGNVVDLKGKYKTSEIKQRSYKSSFDAYTQQFSAGAITSVELLQQQNNYISALNDFIQNKYSFMLERKVLDIYMGEPIKM